MSPCVRLIRTQPTPREPSAERRTVRETSQSTGEEFGDEQGGAAKSESVWKACKAKSGPRGVYGDRNMDILGETFGKKEVMVIGIAVLISTLLSK